MKNIANNVDQPQIFGESLRKTTIENKEKNNKREKTKRSSPAISNPRPENVKGNVMRLRIYRAHACTESYLNRDEEARIKI